MKTANEISNEKLDNKMSMLSKDRNHDHYWIDDDVLYESYRTLR